MKVRMPFALKRDVLILMLLPGLLAAAPQQEICYDRTGKEIPCPNRDKPREPTPKPQPTLPPTARSSAIAPAVAFPTATAAATPTATLPSSGIPAAAPLPADSEGQYDAIVIGSGFGAASQGGGFWDTGYVMLGAGGAAVLALLLAGLLFVRSRRKFLGLLGHQTTPAPSVPQHNETDFAFLDEPSQTTDGFQFNLMGHHMKPDASAADLPLGAQTPPSPAHTFTVELKDAHVADIEFQSAQPAAPTHQHGGTDNANFATPRDTSSPELPMPEGGAQAQNQMGANMLADNSLSIDPDAARRAPTTDNPHELGHVVQGGSAADTSVHELGHYIGGVGTEAGGPATLGQESLTPDSSSPSPDSAEETAQPPEHENPVS